MTREEIVEICHNNNIRRYIINDDLSIDVNGRVNLSGEDLTELPLKFNHVSSDFWCHNNQLTTLEGCPIKVGGGFFCYSNQLTSLIGSPNSVGTHFNCTSNKLTDLKHGPVEIGGDFVCEDNSNITSLDELDIEIGKYGKFHCGDTPLGSIFNGVNQEFIDLFKKFKVIKGNEVNLKRLKYVMSMFSFDIDLDDIENYYTIV